MSAARWDRGVAGLQRLCASGLDTADRRTEALRQLRTLLCIDAAFFATVDPATVLFTAAAAEEPLGEATALFLDNEFGRDDVNKFAALAASADPVATLDHATGGDRSASARYREVMAPLGLGDEARMALGSGGRCWGVLCLHRQDGSGGFAADEIALLRRVAPILGDGLRHGVALVAMATAPVAPGGPGIIVLDADLAVVSINPQAEQWLAELDGAPWSSTLELPAPIVAAAARAAGWSDDAEPGTDAATRVRRSSGGWLTVHASRLRGTLGDQVAVVLDEPDAAQLSSLLLAAHGLTPAQSRVAALVLQGRSTRAIVHELHISSNTVQEHLRAVFDKLGIGSRRELVAVLSGRRH